MLLVPVIVPPNHLVAQPPIGRHRPSAWLATSSARFARRNAASTVVSALITRLHELSVPVQPPVHPENTLSASGATVSVTCVPGT